MHRIYLLSLSGDQVLTSSTAFDVTKGEDAPEIGATGPVTGIAYKDCSWKIPYKVNYDLINIILCISFNVD